ncbi:hypothetical protein ACSVCE_07805 [Chromobacterium haemolyticum]|uniref:hypothetical protein n=1 Tax=Chromobacterium haemolyticum TaxID=394935 RepID=UPI001132179E|nr:hypothetical protein [Chromobacterium haemolyticum]MDH0344099.1 hypothetical protein [Chromobacterium haemolyticum]
MAARQRPFTVIVAGESWATRFKTISTALLLAASGARRVFRADEEPADQCFAGQLEQLAKPNLSGAKYTLGVRGGCPNVGGLLRNLCFSTDVENRGMGLIKDKVRPKMGTWECLNGIWSCWLSSVRRWREEPLWRN